MNINQLQEEIAEKIEECLDEMTLGDRNHSRSDWNLDERAIPSTFWFNEDTLVIPSGSRRSLDYYGGFEYVDKDQITVLGDYIIYTADGDDCRVTRLLDGLNQVEEVCS